MIVLISPYLVPAGWSHEFSQALTQDTAAQQPASQADGVTGSQNEASAVHVDASVATEAESSVVSPVGQQSASQHSAPASPLPPPPPINDEACSPLASPSQHDQPFSLG